MNKSSSAGKIFLALLFFLAFFAAMKIEPMPRKEYCGCGARAGAA